MRYRVGPNVGEFGKQDAEQLLAKKVTEPTHAKWASSIALASKKYVSLRFCVDYQRLNNVKTREPYS